jgi:hypothetical protein
MCAPSGNDKNGKIFATSSSSHTEPSENSIFGPSIWLKSTSASPSTSGPWAWAPPSMSIDSGRAFLELDLEVAEVEVEMLEVPEEVDMMEDRECKWGPGG